MGVKDLWTVLEPVGERCTMADLQGKRLAVDISGWIFQSLQSPVFVKKPTLRPHLRNLFWRLHHLMRNNVRVIIVFDGPSPKLKGIALAKRAVARRQQREKGQAEEEESVDDLATSCGTVATGFRSANAVENTYFAQLCAECKEMLRVFRIPYVVSSGDAESTCAYLNRLGCVDGCITDDNDAFLFGASVVYRHYTCDKKRLENLRCYEAQVIEEQLGLSQDHLIAMALILGCDYGLVGIKGVGKERALEVLQSWPGCDPLEKLSQWRTDVDLAVLMKFDPATKPEHCRFCGHLGNMNSHRSDGCNSCAKQGRACARTNAEEWTCSCEWHRKHAEFKKKQVEIKIMKAAIEDVHFPDKDIIDIYKHPSPDDHPGTFCWTRPQFSEMQKFVSRLFGWSKDKTREKIITYLTAFDLCAASNGELQYHHCSQPEKIIAKRVENGRQMFEVEWRTIPDVPLAQDDTAPNEVITRELKGVFSSVFPELVAEYEELKNAPKKKRGKSKTKPCDTIEEETCSKELNSPSRKKARSKKQSQKSEECSIEQFCSVVCKKSRKRSVKLVEARVATSENENTDTAKLVEVSVVIERIDRFLDPEAVKHIGMPAASDSSNPDTPEQVVEVSDEHDSGNAEAAEDVEIDENPKSVEQERMSVASESDHDENLETVKDGENDSGENSKAVEHFGMSIPCESDTGDNPKCVPNENDNSQTQSNTEFADDSYI